MRILSSLKSLAMNILTAGDRREMDVLERSKIIFLNAVTMAGALMISLFAVIGIRSGNNELGTVCAIAASVIFLNFFAIRLFKRYIVGGIIDCIAIFAFYFYLAFSGGEAGSGVLWSMTYPLITLFLLGPVGGSISALAYGAAIGFVIIHPDYNNAGFPLLYSVRVIGTYFFIWLFALIYEQVRRSTQARLEAANTTLASMAEELRGEKKQSDDILANVLEGIFLLDADFHIGKAHSAWLETVLERPINEKESLLNVLAPLITERDIEAARDYFGLFLSGQVNEDLLQDINPLDDISATFDRGRGETLTKRLHFQFIRVADPTAPWPILGVVTDKTKEYELKLKLELEEDEHRHAMENIFQIIHVDPIMLKEFISDTDSEIDTINDIMREGTIEGKSLLAALFQTAHAIKGNAALLGLKDFANRVHAFENKVKERLDEGHEWKNLLELTIDLAHIKEALDEIRQLITKILRFQTDTRAAGLENANLLRYSIDKLVKRESNQSGIPVNIEFAGFTRDSIPGHYRKLVKDVLIQFIRNSFAHGFEDPATRSSKGKLEEGHISLSIDYNNDALTIRYRDDGKGLDTEAIRNKARAIPDFAAKADSLKPAELARLIFHPGLSTSGEENLSAGRGVGMALVRSRVQEAGGKIGIRSAPGKFVEFTILLPWEATKEQVS